MSELAFVGLAEVDCRYGAREYTEHLEFDVEWATDWAARDDSHTALLKTLEPTGSWRG